jgi:hypothetical protein
MATLEPFYPSHKIESGKYTPGGELIFDDIIQMDYIGLYHILPNGEYWSGSSPKSNSVKLKLKRMIVAPDVNQYNKIKGRAPASYSSPITYYPIVTQSDYEAGYVMRYFVQKRNNPYTTIQEIDGSQFNTLNNRNRPGLSSLLWNGVEIEWALKGIHAAQLNLQRIQRAENDGFLNLSNYLRNPLEFWK